MARKLTAPKQEKALQIVAAWMGKHCHMTEDGSPTPTGDEAARHALGPVLVPAWDWPSNGPTPTIILEGGPDDWAYRASMSEELRPKFAKLGIYAEPYASYALCLYVDN